MIWLGLFRRFWWAIPIALLAGWIGVQQHRLRVAHEALDVTRSNLAAAQAQLKAIRAEMVEQQDKAHKAQEDANAQLQSALSAVDLVSGDLRRRLQLWASDRLRAGSSAGSDPGQPEADAGVDPVVGQIADVLAACRRDAERLRNAVLWAETVGGGEAAPVGAGAR